MNTEEKRKQLAKYCERQGTCDRCEFEDLDICERYRVEGAPADIIEEWFEIVFGKGKECCIKDSGDRTKFASGAVRDMHEGKGRCDLLPLDVVAFALGDWDDTDLVLNSVSQFIDTDCDEYLYEALEHFSNAWCADFPTLFLEVAKHFEEGAKKYGDRNWEKGIPVRCYIDSGVRHYLKWLRGDKDEPHDRAFCWNIICAIWTCWNKPELNEYAKENKSDESE